MKESTSDTSQMTYEQYRQLFVTIDLIMRKEGLIIRCEKHESPTLLNLIEGHYNPEDPKTIFIDCLYEQKDKDTCNDEPVIIAHELGHYFDFKSNPDPNISVYNRERFANGFMIGMCTVYGLEERALSNAKRRMDTLESSGI